MSLLRLSRPWCHACGRGGSLRPSHLNKITTSTPFSTAAPLMGVIRPSPAARKKAQYYGKVKPTASYQDRIEKYTQLKDRFETHHKWIYQDGMKAGALDPEMGLNTFLAIGRGLINAAFDTNNATSQELRKVYTGDPNRIWEVGHLICVANPWAQHFEAWVVTATASAGATIPLIIVMMGQMEVARGHPKSAETDMIIKIARTQRTPIARRAWAELLWRSGRPNDALKILLPLVNNTYPSNMPENRRDDITMLGLFKPPWQLVAEIYNSQGKWDEADQMMKLGALVYRDPTALVAYAYLRKEAEDWAAYEQYLVIAAISENGEACFRLANFYYNIFKGNIPSRDELGQNTNWFATRLQKLIGQSRPKDDFRKLAMDWYELAVWFSYFPAIRNLVVLQREDGDFESAAKNMALLKIHNPTLWNSSNVKKLRDSFHDMSFKPDLPAAWIEL